MSDFYGSYPLKIQVIIHLLQFLIYIISSSMKHKAVSAQYSPFWNYLRIQASQHQGKVYTYVAYSHPKYFFSNEFGFIKLLFRCLPFYSGKIFSMVWLCLNDGLFTNLMNLLSSLTVTKITMLSLIFRGFSKKTASLNKWTTSQIEL